MPILEAKQPKELSDADKKNDTKRTLHEKRIGVYVQREMDLMSNIQAVYSLVWGQCSTALQQKVKGLKDYQQRSDVYDTLWLLESVKKKIVGIDEDVNAVCTFHEALGEIMTMRKGTYETIDDWQQRIESRANSLRMALHMS